VAEEIIKGLADVAKERAKGLAEVDARRWELAREVEAMHKHKEAQEGHVELNIGGYRYETSVQTLRRVPHTFFDAYFSGRYAQDVCRDGSIFVDRDGKHFGQVLQYMRDGAVTVAEPGVHPSVELLRMLKREFSYYCIELVVEEPAEPEQLEVAYVMGGTGADFVKLSGMERYDETSGQWSTVTAMGTARSNFGTCAVEGELYVTGGYGNVGYGLVTVEKYSPSSDTWRAVAPLPTAVAGHAAVAVGSTMYVLGGFAGGGAGVATASVFQFDSVHGTWSQVANMPSARGDCASCAIGSDIYVFGGCSRGYGQTSVFKFDTEANTWNILAPMPVASFDHSVSVLGGLIYIVGVGDSQREVLRFDPASGAFGTLAPTSSHRKCGSSFVLDGFLYVTGGGEGHRASWSVERYDLVSNTWIYVANMPVGRRCFCSGTMAIESAGPTEEQNLFDSLIDKASSRHP
jgi:hypothetical protein